MEAHANGLATLVAVASAFDLAAGQATNVGLVATPDPVGLGGFTGWLEPQTALHRGAKGSIINHAEHKVELDHVRSCSRYPGWFPFARAPQTSRKPRRSPPSTRPTLRWNLQS